MLTSTTQLLYSIEIILLSKSASLLLHYISVFVSVGEQLSTTTDGYIA